jgi:hypothetical protein
MSGSLILRSRVSLPWILEMIVIRLAGKAALHHLLFQLFLLVLLGHDSSPSLSGGRWKPLILIISMISADVDIRGAQ